MIPIWIELQCTQRGARMVNFDNVSSFFASKGRAVDTPDVTIIHMIDHEHITVRDSYDYICSALQKHHRQIRNLFSSIVPDENAG